MKEKSAPELPVLHRLAIVYLMLPVVVWLVGWFEWWLGIPVAALLVCALRRPLSGSWRPRAPSAAEVAALAVAAGMVMMTAAGGVFDVENPDWLEHRATLLDLGRYPWPTYLPDPLAAWRPAPVGEAPAPPPLLRYYLGWHMAPGLVAHWFGPAALSWAVPLWTWAGVALVTLLFTRGCRGRAVAVALLVLFVFSGMDLVRVPALKGWEWVEGLTERRGWYNFLLHEVGPVKLESRMRVLMWAPQHFLPAGLYALLCLQLRRQPRFLAVLGVLLAAAPFWSAFVAVGLLPLLVVLLWENGVRPFLRWPNLCLAGPLFGLVVLYLTSGTMDFPQGWMWEKYDWLWLVRVLPFSYLTEFLLLALLLWMVRPALRREPFFIAGVATLLLLPLYHYGHVSDLQLRGSLPALFLLSWFCADAIARRGGVLVRHGGYRRAAFAGLVLVLGVGAPTTAAELARAGAMMNTAGYGSIRYEHAGNTTLVDLPPGWRRQNVARDVPDLLRWLLREPASFPKRRRPSEPIVRSVFDVYLDGGRLIYVKDRCTPADVMETRLFLSVTPVNPADLPRRHRRFGSVRLLVWQLDPWPWRPNVLDGRCLFGASLPGYPVARIVTGQRWRGERPHRIIWKTEVAFGADLAPARVPSQEPLRRDPPSRQEVD